MITWLLAGACLAAVLFVQPAGAAENADMIFWNSVRDSRNPAEYQAYLNAFPDGIFAPLARVRMAAAEKAAPATPESTAPGAPDAPGLASLVVPETRVRATQRITVEIDARDLRDDSNIRALVVPAATPEALDAETIAALGTVVPAEIVRMTLPPGDAGSNEVRVYSIPRFGRSFVVAARAPVQVEPGAEGAVTVARLAREAASLGAVAFEARYRDRSLRVMGQLLRMQSGTTKVDLMSILQGQAATATDYVVIHAGHLGTPEEDGPTEIACVVAADDRAALDRLAALKPGDDLVMDGIGSTWGASQGAEFVVFNPCRLAT